MKLTVTTIFFILFYLQLSAQPGTLDYSFGDSGKVISSTYYGVAYKSLVQPDGKIVVGGGYGYYLKDNATITGSLIVRYNTDGNLDLSFGDSGRAFYNLGDITSKVAYAIALQKDGKILAAVRGFSSSSIALMRLNSDGTLDGSFGKGGLAIMPNQDASYYGEDMALLPDGRIVITGDVTEHINDDDRSFITCFTSGGFIDNSFADNGTAIVTLSSPMNVTSMAVTDEGKIILGGYYLSYYKTFLLRYNNDGTPDVSFGKNGLAEMYFDKTTSAPNISDIAITDNNNIITAGVAYPNRSVDASVMVSKFLTNGTPDSSFGTNAYTITEYGSNVHIVAVALQTNGKIVAGGNFNGNKLPGDMVTRYDADGTVDSSFGINGLSTTTFTGDDAGASVVIQKDGKIVVTGNSYTTDIKDVTTLARYNGDESKKQIIVTKIKHWLQHHGITWQTNSGVRYYTVQRSNDGGVTFQPVAKIYNNRQPVYNYEETAPVMSSNNTCYRLAVTAKDGERLYSNTVFLNDDVAKVFPNPVRGTLQLQSLPAEGKTNITIVDFNGNVRTSATANSSTYSVNTSNLTPGNYLLKLQHNNTVTTQPFVKE